ncbi:MAG: hypothetical protein ABII06_16790, partial [Pseudomonadota bacterium]
QTKAQQERAVNSITLYYQIVKAKATPDKAKALKFEGTKEYMPLEVDRPLINRVADPCTCPI